MMRCDGSTIRRAVSSLFRYRCHVGVLLVAIGLFAASGCQASSRNASMGHSSGRAKNPDELLPVRAVRCLYTFRPWLNLDQAGDTDPEGIWYRVYLESSDGRREFREGMFHIEMYQIGRNSEGEVTRDLVSDWHYPTSRMNEIDRPGMLGPGYILSLAWAKKSVAGKEIELITHFEDPNGRRTRSETKRFRVPKHST